MKKPIAFLLLTLCACAEEETVTVTSAHVAEDGQITTTETEVTLEEQAAMLAARAELASMDGQSAAKSELRAFLVQTGCYETALWLFDRENFVGNMLCLDGGGNAPLSSFTHHIERATPWSPWIRVSWDRKAYSLWAGERGGGVYDGLFSFNFQPWQQITGFISFSGVVALRYEPGKLASER
jgi:hypothetical protein